jgi:uncharacterized protein YjiS (DUF1127 family)
MSSKSSLATLSGAVSHPTLTLAAIVKFVLAAQYRWQQRNRLADMDDRTLRDMGISRADVYRERQKPIWRD